MPQIHRSWQTLRANSSSASFVRTSTRHAGNARKTPPTSLALQLQKPPHLHLQLRPQLFSTSTQHRKKAPPLPPRPTLPSDDITHVYLKGSGPGGQKINKTNSAAQLTHLPTGIVVKSQATRSRLQNYNIARRILAEKVELLEKGDESRVMKRQERDRKKKASKSKKSRRKYRALEARDGDREEGEHGDEYEEGGEVSANGQEINDGRERVSADDRVSPQLVAEAPSLMKKEGERGTSARPPS